MGISAKVMFVWLPQVSASASASAAAAASMRTIVVCFADADAATDYYSFRRRRKLRSTPTLPQEAYFCK